MYAAGRVPASPSVNCPQNNVSFFCNNHQDKKVKRKTANLLTKKGGWIIPDKGLVAYVQNLRCTTDVCECEVILTAVLTSFFLSTKLRLFSQREMSHTPRTGGSSRFYAKV